MRSAAGLGFLLALGIWVGHALAALPVPSQLPTTTLPTLPLTTAVPTLPTTTVPKLPTTTTVPTLPTTTTVPNLPTTTTVPKLPTTTTPTAQITTTATSGSSAAPVASATKTAGSLGSSGPSGSLAAAGTRSSESSAGSANTAGPSGSSASPQIQLEPSRPFLATKGPKSKRRITLTFVLSHPARVIFAVQQVAPVCRTIGYFSVRGRKGTNRIRFAGRVGRKRLGPGTYTILARTRGGRLVERMTLVVVEDSTPTRMQLRAAQAANVCSETLRILSTSRPGGPSMSFASRDAVERSAGAPFPTGPPNVAEAPSAGVLGATAKKAADAVRPFLVALLAAAILALGLASLPSVALPDNGLSDLLARHRIEILTVGAAALVAVAIAFLIG